jgi:hypothetical protein
MKKHNKYSGLGLLIIVSPLLFVLVGILYPPVGTFMALVALGWVIPATIIGTNIYWK